MLKTLIHTTTLKEANPIIKFFNLEETYNSNIYSNDKIILVVSGLSSKEINKSLEFVFKNYQINKAIDISISSCCDTTIKIGTIFCTNKLIFGFNFANITTVEKDLVSDENLETLLVDKQAEFFTEFINNKIKDFYIIKVVSDYFEENLLDDKEVYKLIENSIIKWKKLV